MKTNEQLFFAFPVDPRQEARAMMFEAFSRIFTWACDAPTLEERGVRTSVLLFCVRPDLLKEQTLEELGESTGRSFQAIHKLVEEFRLATGLES